MFHDKVLKGGLGLEDPLSFSLSDDEALKSGLRILIRKLEVCAFILGFYPMDALPRISYRKPFNPFKDLCDTLSTMEQEISISMTCTCGVSGTCPGVKEDTEDNFENAYESLCNGLETLAKKGNITGQVYLDRKHPMERINGMLSQQVHRKIELIATDIRYDLDTCGDSDGSLSEIQSDDESDFTELGKYD
ncbi:hypothetical protein NW762_001380 [Fusarium torreyae]|uniref:Uncharacterized protein n=1 Tax=Fusarium torreyae TaxID=1237075 RepID=A0A9W8SCD6_9HYPO|nr:hypothetical protein NW762_001380 [Fusarium torreyae]